MNDDPDTFLAQLKDLVDQWKRIISVEDIIGDMEDVVTDLSEEIDDG